MHDDSGGSERGHGQYQTRVDVSRHGVESQLRVLFIGHILFWSELRQIFVDA
jgi:hypothetical protein